MTHRPVPPVLVVQHEDGTGPDLVGEQLTLLGLSLDVHHPWAGQPLPTTLDEWSGLLVLGGAPNCEDDSAAPWFPAVRLLMRQAVDRRIPLLGICLGGQILAHALGGTVRRRAAGPELGAVPLRRLPAVTDDPVFGTVPEGAPAAQWHWDEITRLPDGAVPLLAGDDCVHQAFRVGVRAWGVQFHPEVLTPQVARWAANDRLALLSSGADPDTALASLRAVEPQLRSIWGRTARAWGAVVRAAAADPRTPEASDPDGRRPSSSHAADAIRPLSPSRRSKG